MKNHYPLLLAIAAFLALVALYLTRELALTHGHITYCLDDAYIHMAVAKNLVHHHVWGISPNHWSGVSSSLLWTVMMTGLFSIIGVNEYLPFVLNIVFVVGLLWLLDRIWSRIGLQASQRLLLLTLTFFALPLAAQPFIGMEVMLQCLLVVVFYYTISKPGSIGLLIAAFLLGAVRYETILIVELVSVGMLLRGEAKRGVGIAVAGALPAIIYGLFATADGGTFVPNTLFLKAKGVEIIGGRIAEHGIEAILIVLAVLVLAIVCYRVFRKRFSTLHPSLEIIVLISTVITALAQSVLSNAPEQFERYRTYLYLSLVLCLGLLWAKAETHPTVSRAFNRLPKFIPTAVLLLFTVTFVPRFFFYLEKTPIASKNIYDEQVQEGRFVKLYCEAKPVVVLDIGAVSFYAESPLIDLLGLGSDDIARIHLHRTKDTDTINSIIRDRNARLAILYPTNNYSPDTSWILKGKMAIDSNYVCANNTINFYALRLSDTAWLGESLRDFRTRTTSAIITW